MTDLINLQNAEFDAVSRLAEKYKKLIQVPVVDDDYPEARHVYESAMKDLLVALKNNGRI